MHSRNYFLASVFYNNPAAALLVRSQGYVLKGPKTDSLRVLFDYFHNRWLLLLVENYSLYLCVVGGPYTCLYFIP